MEAGGQPPHQTPTGDSRSPSPSVGRKQSLGLDQVCGPESLVRPSPPRQLSLSPLRDKPSSPVRSPVRDVANSSSSQLEVSPSRDKTPIRQRESSTSRPIELSPSRQVRRSPSIQDQRRGSTPREDNKQHLSRPPPYPEQVKHTRQEPQSSLIENKCLQHLKLTQENHPTSLLRRSSCREISQKEKVSAGKTEFERTGSLLTPSTSHKRASSLKEKVLGRTGRRGSSILQGLSNTRGGESSPPPQRPDRGIFLNFENIKEALFGDSKTNLSPTKTPVESDLFKGEKGKHGTEIRCKTPVKDEFTEFSQYGSRFVPNQPKEAEKEVQENITSTVQQQIHCPPVKKHSRGRYEGRPQLVPQTNKTLGKSDNIVIAVGEASDVYTTKQNKISDVIHSDRPDFPVASAGRLTAPSLVEPIRQHPPHLRGFSAKSDSDSGFDGESTHSSDFKIKQVDIQREYDLIQLIGEGWFSRVYLAEHRLTRDEVVLKAMNSNLVSAEEFLREFQSSSQLWPHKNILKVYDAVFQSDGYFIFATEYAPLGDLTSNISTDQQGLGEVHTKKVAKQIGSALEWIHAKNLCHLDVKLDNILVFKSDFSLVKLCDFGSVRNNQDIVIKKNELLPYCPAELVAKHANEYYQVDRVQDVFQFGIVIFFCLQGVLPWQKADTADPHFAEFAAWRRKRSSKIPRNFKPMTSRAQKLFRKLLDPDPSKRLVLVELAKYLEDKWLRKVGPGVGGRDGQSQLTLGSFQSVHSNAVEKNVMLYTLLQHGVETTVDRSHKNNRIINWIKQGAERSDASSVVEDDIEEEIRDKEEYIDDLDNIDIDDLPEIDK